VGIDER
jgi:hypothetical protein